MPEWLLTPVTVPAWTLLLGDALVLALAALAGACVAALLRRPAVASVRSEPPARD